VFVECSFQFRPISAEALSRIAGADELVTVFGGWPSFHDAEVLWIRLDRQSYGRSHGPTIEALIHAFEMTSEIDDDGHYGLRNHVLVHFRFAGVGELQLDGFNHQNVIMELAITDIRERQLENLEWDVRFDPTWGVGASFQCHAIEVVGVIPCDKACNPNS
jgi:hypothetical protein